MTSPSTPHSSTPGSSTPRARDAARRAGRRDTVGVPVPLLGTVHLSRPQLAYVVGIAALTAVELLSWPVGLALGLGHLLAADRDSATLEDFGEALEEA